MNAVLKTFLSMSVSGSLLILALLAGKRFLKDTVSRQWQYYIWLVVILRLLLPFGAEISLMGQTYQAIDQAVAQAAPFQQLPDSTALPDNTYSPAAGQDLEALEAAAPAEVPAASHPVQDMAAQLLEHIWLAWLIVALCMLIRKITVYQSFVRYINSGSSPVSDTTMLDRLAIAAEQEGIRQPAELCVNPLISSPLLTGFFRPCIVLPSEDISERDFRYTVLHELTHYKRRDMFYKWLTQITICLHWFNPLVYLMGREITKACEFSCDEAVLSKMGPGCAQEYGSVLLNAMAAVGKYRESAGAVTLSENKQLLKERITAIMNFKKKSNAVRLLTGVLTVCMIFGASFIGVYSAGAADVSRPVDAPLSGQSDSLPAMGTMTVKGMTYYLVSTEEQLRAIGTGRYGMDQNYMQQADIQLSTKEWIPIGTWEKPFTGTFNGNGFEIIGLTMTDPEAKIIGLFGVAKEAHIYNITLRDLDIINAGKNASEKSVGAVLAIGQGSQSHDNRVYPKGNEASLTSIEKYYEAGSLPLFQIVFSRLDEAAQEAWLERIYEDGDFSFFSAAVYASGANPLLLGKLAEKAYEDDQIAFLSILTDYADEDTLEDLLDRALEDGKWNFQSMLFSALDRGAEFDELETKKEKEWAEAQAAEYQAAGITADGKNYYYQGQLVNIFLDIRKGGAFYVLDMNPKGTVNIEITRNADGQIDKVRYMTDAEAEELLSDMRDEN